MQYLVRMKCGAKINRKFNFLAYILEKILFLFSELLKKEPEGGSTSGSLSLLNLILIRASHKCHLYDCRSSPDLRFFHH